MFDQVRRYVCAPFVPPEERSDGMDQTAAVGKPWRLLRERERGGLSLVTVWKHIPTLDALAVRCRKG